MLQKYSAFFNADTDIFHIEQHIVQTALCDVMQSGQS
jgi:hypothetical protein